MTRCNNPTLSYYAGSIYTLGRIFSHFVIVINEVKTPGEQSIDSTYWTVENSFMVTLTKESYTAVGRVPDKLLTNE